MILLRGLGIGGPLVTVGLGLGVALAPTPPPSVEPSRGGGGYAAYRPDVAELLRRVERDVHGDDEDLLEMTLLFLQMRGRR